MSPHARTRAAGAAAALALALLPLAAAAPAPAAVHHKAKPTVTAVKNPTLHRAIVVNAKGRTLYRLSPETPTQLLCSGFCLSIWPALLVPAHTKPVAGKGVSGKLATLRRGKKRQVTLRGAPLYTFDGDSAAGQVNGDGIVSFGGTWHAVDAKPAR